MMDAAAVTAKVKDLNEANSKGRTEDVIKILKTLKTEVVPNEELLKTSKAGVAVGKLRQSTSPGISNLAKEVVKLWKEAIEQAKQKRKRDDGDEVKKEDGTKRPKAGSTSAAPSPLPNTPTESKPKSDIKPKSEAKSEIKAEGEASSSSRKSPTGTGNGNENETDGVLTTIDTTLKSPRTAAMDGMEKSLKVEGDNDDTRDKCVVMLYNALAIDSRAESRILKERALGIEKALFESMKGSTGNDYRGKIRSLFLNLKEKGNPGLRNKIVLGDVSPDKVVTMSKEDMASESVKAMNQKITENNLFKAKAVGETNAETDAFKCSRCQQRKCTYYQMQTRSADEPMTTFVTCVNCGNKWKFS